MGWNKKGVAQQAGGRYCGFIQSHVVMRPEHFSITAWEKKYLTNCARER